MSVCIYTYSTVQYVRTYAVNVCMYGIVVLCYWVLSVSSSRGLFTSDLTHLDDGNNNFTHDKLINFTKCVLIYNRIRDFMLYQVCGVGVWCVVCGVWCVCMRVWVCVVCGVGVWCGGVGVCVCVCVCVVCVCVWVYASVGLYGVCVCVYASVGLCGVCVCECGFVCMCIYCRSTLA